ncbi:MAG TPA: DnaJ domain-containing protein [Stellaceae bacterium]
MIYLGLGVVVLILVLGLSRAFVAADPAKLARRLGRLVGAVWQRRQSVKDRPPRRSSEVETDYIRMRLDHDSGTMSGLVRRGPFQGRRLDELTQSELLALWRQCRVEDEAGANLLEAYLDRLLPDWRVAAQRAGSAGGGKTSPRPADAMTRAEAYEVLGLSWGAGETEIREAHRRLMMKLHPDQGGSTYLAAKLNRAREVLLAG